MKLKIFILSFMLALGVSIQAVGYYEEPMSKNIVASGVMDTNISARVTSVGETNYICIDDVLKASGYELGWESYHGAVIVYNPVLCQNMYVYLNRNEIFDGRVFIKYDQPIIIHNGFAYITEQMLFDLTKDSFIYEIKPPVVEDPMDKYRRSGNVVCYNGIYLLGNWFAFEKVALEDDMCKDYADAVNTVAESLGGSVNVYNMAIPNSAEYYAPKMHSTNLRRSYDIIYQNLSDKVEPVDIYQILFDHAEEYIFFNTDHHWTQLGAYWAYLEFANIKGIEVPENRLKKCDKYYTQNVVGSFGTLMEGTEGGELIKGSGEMLQRFIPTYEITKDVYYDCAMQKKMGSGQMIIKSLKAYSTFLGGDVPVMKLHNKDIKNGKTLCIIKDSYANAFATWAICDYEYVYLIDIRCFNGANGHEEVFDIADFQKITGFEDLLIMSYPNTIYDYVLRDYIRKLA